MWPDSWPCNYHARRKGVCRDWDVFQHKTVSSNKVKVTREYSGLGDKSLRALPRNQERNKNRIVIMFIWNSIWDPCQGNTIKKQKKKYEVKHEEQYHYLWMICSCLYKTQVSYWLNIKTDRNSREVIHIKTNILKYIAFLYNKSAAHLLNHKYSQQDGKLTKKNYEIH